MQSLVKFGRNLVNLDAVCAAHWEKGKLWMYFIGGRFQSVEGPDAEAVWQLLESRASDLVKSDKGALSEAQPVV